MITTTVKEAKAGILNLAAGAAEKPQGKKDGDSFQSIFDRQTGRDAGRTDKAQAKPAGQVRKTLKKQEAVSTDNTVDNDLDEEQYLAEANEAALDAVAQMMAKLSEVLSVSAQEIQEAMQDLGLEGIDLLTEQGLNDLTLALEGSQDSMELLTNGEVYGKLQELLETQKAILDDARQNVGMSGEELLEAAKLALSGADEEGNQNGTAVNEAAPELTLDAEQEQRMEGAAGTGREETHQDRSSEEKDSEGSGNLVLDQMLQDAREAGMEPQVTETATAERVDTDRVMQQIMDHMKAQLKPDVSSLEMQLHPASLGSLQVHLSSRGGAVTAQFFAQNEAVKAALETQMVQLRESFEEQGIKVDAIEVAVQTHEFEQNLEEQGRGRQEQQTPKSRSTRRIRIDDTLTEEQLSELTQDERINAEMMQAGGGTVDFTA